MVTPDPSFGQQPNVSNSQRRWWETAVIYQVYVRSFYDTDGDGYGDLPGVTAKLEHLRWLGVDVVWLSPIMPSPDRDWGYDVSDYTGVHPELGTPEDLSRLIAEADRLGIKVVLDLVPNHTSNLHPWFVEGLIDTRSPKRDYYVWANAGPNGGPPNNWLAATGSPAWNFEPKSRQFYLHNFLPDQPDLNWWNPEVQRAFEEIIRHWLDQGVAGFRIDVAHGLFHDLELRDNPSGPVGPESRFGQIPLYNVNRPEVHQLYRSWRAMADSYQPPRLLLGETWVLDVNRLAAFYGRDDELHLAFNFNFVFAKPSPDALAGVVADTLRALPPRACPVWVASNHDIPRFPTRWAKGSDGLSRLLMTVLCTLPGTVVLYQGDELGLGDVEVPVEQQRDPMSWRSAPGRYNRDRARTPLPWDEQPPNHGFCPPEVEPWLPLGPRSGVSVAAQHQDPGSFLHLTRQLLGLRQDLGDPDNYELLEVDEHRWVYRRGLVMVAANFSSEPLAVDLHEGRPLLSSLSGHPVPVASSGTWQLAPFEALVIDGGHLAG